MAGVEGPATGSGIGGPARNITVYEIPLFVVSLSRVRRGHAAHKGSVNINSGFLPPPAMSLRLDLGGIDSHFEAGNTSSGETMI